MFAPGRGEMRDPGNDVDHYVMLPEQMVMFVPVIKIGHVMKQCISVSYWSCFSGVQYYTGQYFDMKNITAFAQKKVSSTPRFLSNSLLTITSLYAMFFILVQKAGCRLCIISYNIYFIRYIPRACVGFEMQDCHEVTHSAEMAIISLYPRGAIAVLKTLSTKRNYKIKYRNCNKLRKAQKIRNKQ